MLEDIAVGFIKFCLYVIAFIILVGLLAAGIVAFIHAFTTPGVWWFSIPIGLTSLWAFVKWGDFLLEGEFDPEVMPFASLLKVLILFVFAGGAFALITFTSATTWWFTVPGIIILVVLALFWLNTVFEFYVPGFDRRDGLGGDGGPEIWDN